MLKGESPFPLYIEAGSQKNNSHLPVRAMAEGLRQRTAKEN